MSLHPVFRQAVAAIRAAVSKFFFIVSLIECPKIPNNRPVAVLSLSKTVVFYLNLTSWRGRVAGCPDAAAGHRKGGHPLGQPPHMSVFPPDLS